MLKGARLLILDTISDFPFLARSDLRNGKKLKVFLTYILISIKLFTLHRIFNIKQEYILGMKVSCFDYGTLHFLFREIFLRNLYCFDSGKKNPIILDCGANMGMATLYFKWLYPDCVIYAFEPDPVTFALLEKNVKQNNFRNVNLYNVALLDKKGKTGFYVDHKSPGWLTMSVVRERLPKDRIVVRKSPLSDFVGKPGVDFLKIDVEGAENIVLFDLVKTGKIKAVREMVVEFHNGIGDKKPVFSRFLSLLEKNGFKYRISASAMPLNLKDVFQDINVYAYRKIR